MCACVWASLGDSYIDRMSCRGGLVPRTQRTSSHSVTTATALKDAHINTVILWLYSISKSIKDIFYPIFMYLCLEYRLLAPMLGVVWASLVTYYCCICRQCLTLLGLDREYMAYQQKDKSDITKQWIYMQSSYHYLCTALDNTALNSKAIVVN